MASPMLTPLLARIFLLVSGVFLGYQFDNDVAGMAALLLLNNFGNFFVLNTASIPFMEMLSYSSGMGEQILLVIRYLVIVATQLVLIVICANYALAGVRDRRQTW